MTNPIDRDRLSAVLGKYRLGGAGETVLVVEDDALIREQVRGVLAAQGCAVVEAANGRVALERLVEARPDLILLDLMMPEMDGFAFTDELRRHEDWRSIPIVVMTGKDLTAEDRRRLSGHVEEIVRKRAYSREELLCEVRDRVVAHAPAHLDATPPHALEERPRPRGCNRREAIPHDDNRAAALRTRRRRRWRGNRQQHRTDNGEDIAGRRQRRELGYAFPPLATAGLRRHARRRRAGGRG